MAEFIFAGLLIVAGVVCTLGAVFVVFGNAMGSVTNASAVNLRPAIWLALGAVAGIGGGILTLVY